MAVSCLSVSTSSLSSKAGSLSCLSSSNAQGLGRSSAVFISSPSCLSIKLQSSPSNSSFSHRSSIWGATSVRYLSEFGTVSLLLLASGLFQKATGPTERETGGARAYLETSNPVAKFFNRVQGALPVVGLISRLVSPEGGIGTDRIRFEEFCTRIGRNCTREDSIAFFDFAERHGKAAKIPFVLIWCWAAALGAGLLRSDDLLMGAARLSVSYDIQYEVENFELLMDEALKKREKSGSKVPDVPIEARAEKSLEAICKCCTGRMDISEEDAPLLSTILKCVFPSADKEQIDLMVASRLFDPFSAEASESQSVEEEAPAGEQLQGVVQELLQ